MLSHKNIAKHSSKMNILNECLSDFKKHTGYDFCEILKDKQKFNSFIAEDNKKDLQEYKEKCHDILKSIKDIYTDIKK